MLLRLIPKLFYADIEDGLDLFVGTLGFRVLYRDKGIAVVERGFAKAYLIEDAEFAAKDRPEITVETDTINEIFAEVSAGRPDMLHPNAAEVSKKPWGALEFAVRDRTGLCVVFRQW